MIEQSERQLASLASYPLLDALINRRTRRFGKGFNLNGGPLQYKSNQEPEPLTVEEESALAFAASGITGYALAELPYQTGSIPDAGGGNIMAQFVARIVNSGDALHTTAVGLERDGHVLLKAYCPPYYRNMREAVLAYADYKYAQGRGTFRDGGQATAWQDGATVQAGIPTYSDKAIEAAIAYCEYVHHRYGRFPASSAPYRTLLTFQAHHLDLDFYASSTARKL